MGRVAVAFTRCCVSSMWGAPQVSATQQRGAGQEGRKPSLLSTMLSFIIAVSRSPRSMEEGAFRCFQRVTSFLLRQPR